MIGDRRERFLASLDELITAKARHLRALRWLRKTIAAEGGHRDPLPAEFYAELEVALFGDGRPRPTG
jgi:hypothetical protein